MVAPLVEARVGVRVVALEGGVEGVEVVAVVEAVEGGEVVAVAEAGAVGVKRVAEKARSMVAAGPCRCTH